ncbi:uncharacterized protein LOC141859341 [Acropora palmata]|uniref:uncharacterized protein LOC141859341 n=1 Tax=Acropora palmata TaxID=6131 RepID=UPI003DA0BAF7
MQVPPFKHGLESQATKGSKDTSDQGFLKPMIQSRVRNRREASHESSQTIAIHEVRQNIIKLEQLVPGKFCKASEKLCLPAPGPPGLIGFKGTRGRRGPQGTKGRRGAQDVIGPPVKAGKSGMAGPSRPKRDKGETG